MIAITIVLQESLWETSINAIFFATGDPFLWYAIEITYRDSKQRLFYTTPPYRHWYEIEWKYKVETRTRLCVQA